MHSSPRTRSRSRPLRSPGPARWLGLAAALVMVVPQVVEAQYFGRNKVQYDEFDFQILETPHFDIHFYPEKSEAIEDVARMSERWYERLARVFQHDFSDRKPLIFYADHPDFQQTNTIGGHIGEGTGGVTEGLKNRVVMPLGESYAATDHVLGHELVHAFQFNIAQGRAGGGLQSLMRLPLWLVEGMAEYLSLGQEYPHTGMYLRDALLRDEFPTLRQLTREQHRYFPYRYGHAFWVHVGQTYGDDAVIQLFRRSLRVGWERGIEEVLHKDWEELSEEWLEAAEAHYRPLMEDRTPPGEAGALLISPETGSGRMNVAPSVSPDGAYVAFMSERDLFSIDLYLADARTGELIRRIARAESDPHSDALRFIDSAGTWSPDSRLFAYVVFARGRNEIVIRDVERGREERRIRVSEEIGEITNPSWSADGERIVFSAQVGGLTDLFVMDLETEALTRITRDRHANLQPTLSPDGRMVAFISDRGPETDFDRLVYSQMRLTLYDMQTEELEVLDIFGDVHHANPQFTPDGRGLFFLSDQDGFQDIYRLDLENRDIRRVTEMATGVSGITPMAPAMTVARETGTVVFSVFTDTEYHIYSLDLLEVPEGPVVARVDEAPGRLVPPAMSDIPSRVQAYLADPDLALAAPTTFGAGQAREYDPSLSLDLIGQPTIGAGTDRFGTFVAGSVFALFSDMLGDRQLGVAVQAQGEIQDIGGQFFYQNRRQRWNWGVGASRIPFRFMQTQGFLDPDAGTLVLLQDRIRQFMTNATVMAQYPFSTTRRAEFAAGVNRFSWSVERDRIELNQFGQVIDFERSRIREGLPDPLNLVEGSAALVGDNSIFGLVSPVRGSRWRLEVQQTMGSLDFTTGLVDYRRYYNPFTELTVAFRGLHLGRYGSQLQEQSAIQPIFLGMENLIRGYSFFSLEGRECRPDPGQTNCPQLDRLFGNRIGVANAELRVPVLGVDRFGLANVGFMAAELVAFADAGVAWSAGDGAELRFERESTQRIPVFSTGLSTRMNLLGAFILEVYYAYPFQRPDKGAHWGFQLAPGW